MNERNDGASDAGEEIKTENVGFGEPRPTDEQINQEQLATEAAKREHLERLKVRMREILNKALEEVESGMLHGIAVVKVNEEHEVASAYSICKDAGSAVAHRMQEISMDLALPPGAVREIRGLMSLLRGLGG